MTAEHSNTARVQKDLHSVLDCECCELAESFGAQRNQLHEIHLTFLICDMFVRGETQRHKP